MSAADEASRITAAEFEELVRTTTIRSDHFPFSVISLAPGDAVIRLAFHEAQLRAGGTLSGPTMFTLADTALYAAVLTRIGMVPLAVTSDLAISFLTAVGTIEIASEGTEHGVLTGPLVAHATGTYAIP